MGLVAGLAAGALAAGASAYSSSQASNAAQNQQNQQAQFTHDQLNAFKTVKAPSSGGMWDNITGAAGWNSGQGVNEAQTIATKTNAGAVNDLQSAMGNLFGGGSTLASDQEQTNQIIQSELSGQVSQSTQQALGRQMLDSGVGNLGGGAASQMYAGFLGQTTEGQQSQGMGNYRSLYGMYRQALPFTTASQSMGYTTMSPVDMNNAAMTQKQNVFNDNMQRMGAGYQVGYNGLVMNAASTNSLNQINSQLYGQIGKAAGNMAGQWQGYSGGYNNGGANASNSYGPTYDNSGNITGYTVPPQ